MIMMAGCYRDPTAFGGVGNTLIPNKKSEKFNKILTGGRTRVARIRGL